MFKKNRHMNKEVGEILQKNKTYYTFSFITLVFAFLFFNISLTSIYNIYNTNNKLNKDYNMKIYINNNVSQNSIEDIEKALLHIDNVVSVSYEGKELALDLLSKQLGLSSKNINNPLLNSFEITTTSQDDLDQIAKQVEGLDGVKEAVINQSHAKKLDEEIKRNKQIMELLLFITLIPIFIMIFSIMHSTVASQGYDIQSKHYLGMNKKEILKPYYFINNFKFIFSGIVGGLVFLNLYQFVHTQIPTLNNILSLTQVGIVSVITLVIISIIFPIASFSLIRVKR